MPKEPGMNVGINLHYTSSGLPQVTASAQQAINQLSATVSGATRELTGLMAQGGRISGGGAGRTGGGGGRGRGGGGGDGGLGDADIPEQEYVDAIKRMARSARFNAGLADKIAQNSEGVLDEHVKLKMAISAQRRAFVSKFDIGTKEGRARTQELAKTSHVERQQRLAQRAFETQETLGGAMRPNIRRAVDAGGVQREAAVKVLDAQRSREVAIAQAQLDLSEKSARSIAQKKVLLDQVNREVAKEVRKQQDIVAIAEENAAVRRQKVKQERENIKAIRNVDREKEAILARETRGSRASQELENQARMRTALGKTILAEEGKAAAGARVQNAAKRQEYLKQFDVKTAAGREATGTLATTAVGEREQQMAQRSMEIEQQLASGGAARIAHTKALEAALAREVSIEQSKIDLASGAASSMAREKVQRDELNRQVSAQVRTQQDVAAIAKENVAKERDRLAQRGATRKAETPDDRAAIARDKVDEAARQRDIASRARAQQDVGAIAQENAAIARQRIAQQRADIGARTPADVKDEASFAIEKRLVAAQARLAEQVELRSAAGQRLGLEEQALFTQTAELKAIRAQMRAGDQRLIVAEATEARAREEQAARVAVTRYGGEVGNLQGAELTAQAAVLQRAYADRERAAISRQTGAEEREAAAQRKLEEAKLRSAIRVRERELIKESIASGDVKSGTFFQQLQFRLRPSQTKLPEEYLGAKQFMGEKAMTTFGFAASGMALGGGIAAISEMFKDASRLEQTFVRLRGQMEGLGKIEAFGDVREQIHAIAAETGQAGDKVASLVSRLVGISGDPLKAVTEARSASQLSTVTGMDPKELEKSLVPISRAFKLDVNQIGDGIVDLAEKTGASEEDITSFFGKTAAAAHNAGLSYEEVQIIGGTMANALGGAFGSAGESINKVFTTVVSNADKIVGVLAESPETAKFIKPFSEQIGAGDPGQAYLTLVRAYKQFSQTQKDSMVQNVVSRREAEDFYAVFDNADEVIAQVDTQQQRAADSSGKMAKRWIEFKDTVTVTMQRIATSFESLGDALFRSGLADFLTTLGQAMQFIVGTVGIAVNAFASFNEVTAGVPMTLLKIIGVAAVLGKSYGLLSTVIGKTGLVSQEQAKEETGATGAKAQGVQASNTLAASEQRLAAAKLETITASRGQTQALGGAAAARGVPAPFQYGVSGGTARAGAEVAAGAGALPQRLGAGPARLVDETRAVRAEAARSAATQAAAVRAAGQREVSAGLVSRYWDKRTPEPFRTRPGQILPIKEYNLAQERGIVVQETYARATVSGTEATVGTAAAATTLGARQEAAAEAQRGATRAAGRLTRAQTDLASQLALDARNRRGISGLVRRSQQAMGSGYDTRRADVLRRLGPLEEGAVGATPGFFSRSMSGGTILKSARSDIGMERAGLTSGAKLASLPTAMLAIAGAAVVKGAYDKEVEEVQSAADAARLRLRQMSLSELQREAGTQGTDFGTRMYGWLFRQATPESLVTSELAAATAADTGATARLGGKARVPAAKSAAANTKQILADEATRVGTAIGARLTDDRKAAISALFAADKDFRDKGAEIGLSNAEEVTKLIPDLDDLTTKGHAKTYSAKAGGEISPEAIAKARKFATDTEGLDEGQKEKKYKLQIALDQIESGQANLGDLATEAAKIGSAEGVAAAMDASNQSTEDFVKTWAGGQDEGYKDIQVLQQEFQSGRITQAQYIDGVRKRLGPIKEAGEGMKKTPKGQEMLAIAGQTEHELALLEENSMKFLDDLATNMAMIGSTRPKGTKATRHAATLAKSSMETQMKELPSLMQEEVEAWQEDAAKVFDPQARIDALNAGPKYSATTAKAYLATQAKASTKVTDAIQKLADATGLSPDAVRDQIAERAQATGKSFVEAGNEWITEQYRGALDQHDLSKATKISIARRGFGESLADVQNLPDQQLTDAQRQSRQIDIMAGARKARGRLAQAEAGANTLKQAAIATREAAASYGDVQAKVGIHEATQEDLDNAKADMLSAQQAEANAWFQFAQLRMQREVILADRDPVKENAAQMRIAQSALANARKTGDVMGAEQAEQQIMQLQQQAAENQLNIIRGAMAVAGALDAEDPMKSAVNALKAAEFELANAHGEADREQKEASVIAARQRLTSTISSALTADAQLAITMANLRGDTVGAAVKSAQNAKRLLDEAVAKGITDRNILAPLEASLAEANKSLYLAPIQKQIADLDYVYGLEQTSLGQYVAGLKTQLSRMVYDSQEYRDLNLKIHGLEKSAQQDIQFNLPSEIQLPTLYEARRLNQSRSAGIGYMDNRRNIAVTFNVNGAQDPTLVASQITNALQTAMGAGQLYTPGVSTGAFN